jgi:outer membrane protein OmpA-like peptidoglycan-associated protein
MIAIRSLALVVVLIAAASPALAQVNVAGTWTTSNWTLKISLQQEGDRVWGYGGAKDFWFRGRWDAGRLVLQAVNLVPDRSNSNVCTPRGTFVLSGKTVARLTSAWLQADSGRTLKGTWTRTSPDSGEALAYPYAAELERCGSIATYELGFASGSDKLLGADWPVLEAVAKLLAEKPALKITVLGHTDDTGAAPKNQALSEKRAEAVKSILVGKYGADAARITSKGAGQEQPITENKTADDKAINRRVEIVLAR